MTELEQARNRAYDKIAELHAWRVVPITEIAELYFLVESCDDPIAIGHCIDQVEESCQNATMRKLSSNLN